jgi:hypothetical protein
MHFAGKTKEIQVRLLAGTVDAIDALVGDSNRSWLVDLAVTAYIKQQGPSRIRRHCERLQADFRDEVLSDAYSRLAEFFEWQNE